MTVRPQYTPIATVSFSYGNSEKTTVSSGDVRLCDEVTECVSSFQTQYGSTEHRILKFTFLFCLLICLRTKALDALFYAHLGKSVERFNSRVYSCYKCDAVVGERVMRV